MATIQTCDFCNAIPRDHAAPSGGDVRRVALTVAARENGVDATPDGLARRCEFDACAACRLRLLGAIFENVAPQPVYHPLTSAAQSLRLAEMERAGAVSNLTATGAEIRRRNREYVEAIASGLISPDAFKP